MENGPDTSLVGRRVSWKGVNRTESGVVVREDEKGVFVRLDNNKYVILQRDGMAIASAPLP